MSDDSVEVERETERRSAGIVSRLRVETTSEHPVAFQVVDEIPPELTAEHAGFKPDSEPERGEIDDDSIVVADVVSADADVEIVYGIKPDDSETEMSLGELRIERSMPIEGDEEINWETFTATVPDEHEQTDESDEPGASSGGVFDRMRQLVGSGGEGADGTETEAAHSPEDDDITTSILEDDDAPPADHTDDTDAAADTDGGQSDGGERTDSATQTDTERDDSDDGASETTARPDRNVVSALVDELEAGEPTDEELETLKEAVGTASQSTDVRIRHIQSRMDDFAAYTQTLEELIDDHGEPTEVVATLREDVDGAHSAVESLRAELAETRTELSDQIDDIEAELQATQDRLDAVDDRGSRLETELEDELASIRTDVEDLRTTTATFESLREQLASVFDPAHPVDEPAGVDASPADARTPDRSPSESGGGEGGEAETAGQGTDGTDSETSAEATTAETGGSVTPSVEDDTASDTDGRSSNGGDLEASTDDATTKKAITEVETDDEIGTLDLTDPNAERE
ncbi:MAG: hypothetical protein PPP58_06855 [Natronomonas sp.]